MDIQEVALTGIGVLPHRLRALRSDVVAELAASMRERGLLHPIVLRAQDGSGYWLVAGRHRLEAAKSLGWKAIMANVVTGFDAVAAELAEIDENLIRADLTPAERADHQARRKKLYEQLHPETRLGQNQHTRVRKLCEPTDRFTADAAAKTGRSERAIQLEAKRGAAIPNVASLAGTSLDKGEELDALAALPKESQADLIARAKDGEKVSAKAAAKKEKRAAKEAALAQATGEASKALGTKLYGVIYADPPWRFEPYSRDTGMDRAADNHYPTMTLADIKALHVPAADDAALFLWATAPMLPEALAVMAEWGFTYRSHLIWTKDRAGTGYWFRNRHELLLVGTRGKIPAPAPGENCDSVQAFDRGPHSAKPHAFAEIIEEMFPNAARLEMFARAPRLGWDTWGNEAPVPVAAE
jgi:N6-adenosine-specific RNA methylase IME4